LLLFLLLAVLDLGSWESWYLPFAFGFSLLLLLLLLFGSLLIALWCVIVHGVHVDLDDP
jgi:hypothetical protein